MKKLISICISLSVVLSSIAFAEDIQEESNHQADNLPMQSLLSSTVPQGGQQLLATFDNETPTDYFEIGAALKITNSFSQVRSVLTSQFAVEGIKVNNSDTSTPHISYKDEGNNASLIVEYDVMFEDIVSSGSVAYLKTTDADYFSTYTTSATGLMFNGEEGTIKTINKPGGTWTESTVNNIKLEDKKWYRVRNVINITGSGNPPSLVAKHSIYINGKQSFSNLQFISTNYYKFPTINAIVLEKDVNSNKNPLTMYLDNILFYKINENCTETPEDYGEFLSAIRNAQSDLWSSSKGTGENDYSEEVYAAREAAINEAAMKFYDAEKTLSSLKNAINEMNTKLSVLGKNGLPLKIEKIGMKYLNAAGTVVSAPLVAAKAVAYANVKTSRFANPNGEKIMLLAAMQKDKRILDTIDIIKSSPQFYILPDSTQEISVEFDISSLSVSEKLWVDFKCFAISSYSDSKLLHFSDGYVKAEASENFAADFGIKDDDTGRTLEISVISGAYDDILLRAYKLNHLPSTEAEGLMFIGQKAANENGTANFAVRIPAEYEDGEIYYEVYSANNNRLLEKKLSYFTVGSVNDAFSRIYSESSDIAAVNEIVKQYREGFGLRNELYEIFILQNAIPQNSIKAVIDKQYTYSTKSEFVENFEKLLSLDAINYIKDSQTLVDLLGKDENLSIAEDIGLSTQENKLKADRYLRFLSSEYASEVVDSLKKSSEYNKESFVNAFNEYSFLTELRHCANKDMISTVLENSSDLLTNYTKYQGLTSTKKAEVAALLYDERIAASSASFNEKINEAITKVNAATEPKLNVKTGSGGGGGGGRMTPATVPVVQEAPASPKVTNPFEDMGNYAWAEDAVNVLYNKGVVKGKSETQFAPGDNVTREEFVKMAVLLFELFENNAECQFDDVSKNDWCYKYIASAQKKGIVNGISDSIFGVGENLTREQLVTLTYRAGLTSGLDFLTDKVYIAFDDDDKISDYAKEAVENMAAANIVEGNDNMFYPSNKCTRAEAAKVLYNTYLMLLAD